MINRQNQQAFDQGKTLKIIKIGVFSPITCGPHISSTILNAYQNKCCIY